MPARVIAIVGPTAVGKSSVAEDVAVALGAEVVSADSMQVYRGMDIGTAKTPVGARRVPYHCIDLVAPGEPYSAALYQRDARRAIDAILHSDHQALIVGGTGLYVRAALDEFDFPAGELTTDTRASLEARAAVAGPLAMHAELASLDPAAAARIHPNNVRRTIRALEMLAEGRPYSEQAEGFTRRQAHYPDTRLIGLTMERPALYSRIDARVDAMIGEGLLDEVASLARAGYGDALTASQGIGYKELMSVISGAEDLAPAVERIKQATRRYAKRQLSWFRADPRIEWIDVTELSPAQSALVVLRLLESSEP